MRRSVFVAESKRPSLAQGECSPRGEDGAELARNGISTSRQEPGRSSDTLLLGLTENFGIGNELGGGELEYVGPAQSSESKMPPLGTTLKPFFSFLWLIGTGALLGVVLQRVLLGFEGVNGVLGRLSGVGRTPYPVWKLLQFMALKSLECEEEPNSA